MTETVSPTAPATTTAGTGAARPPSGRATIAADFEVFLQMLTTQLKYQDPMNPADSTEFAGQLATFAGVEQQVLGNELLTGMSAQLTTGNMAQVGAWIGQEVRAATPVMFRGDPVTISPNPAQVADRAELVVRDKAGTEVMRQALPVSADPFQWTGIRDDGTTLPQGIYRFEVVSYQGGEALLTETAEVYARVVEIRSQEGVNMVVFDGGLGVPAGSVSAIRVPGSQN